MKKRVGIFLALLCMCLGLCVSDTTVWAATGKTTVAVSANTINIGDTVTVTGKATGPDKEKVLATMQLSWDASILQFVSCSVDSNGGGGNRLVNGDSFTITLKAVSAGKSTISLSASDGVLFDTVESLDAMEGSSTSVTVNNAAAAGTDSGANNGSDASAGNGTTTDASAGTGSTGGTLSADNSLKALTISPGTLSPSFSYSTTSYTATVGSDVTNIVVSATPTNAKAVVESVTGNENLAEGANTIQIVVRAENGVTATYTIKVTKQAAAGSVEPSEKEEEETSETKIPQETIEVNGVKYQISTAFSKEDIPTDFVEHTISYHENSYKGVSYRKGTLQLLWLVPANVTDNGDSVRGRFFIYDETKDSLYPFVKFSIGTSYVIALEAPDDAALPETYSKTSIAVDEEDFIFAYQTASEDAKEGMSDFYLFYGVNHDGTKNWYQYDSLEGTYQRLASAMVDEESAVSDEEMSVLQDEYDALSQQYRKEKGSWLGVIALLIFTIAVFVIVLINLLLAKNKKHDDDDFDDDFDDDLSENKPEEDEHEDVFVKVVRSESPKLEKESTPSKMKDLDIIDFNDL